MEVVSFDLAQKLKEKGYPQEPKNRCQYYEWDGLRNIHPLSVEVVWYESENKEYLYSAPTISQVLKWLREKKIDAGATWDNSECKWIAYASEMNMPDLVGLYTMHTYYNSWEEASLAIIEYVLDNLI